MSYAKSFLKRREKSNTGKAEYKSADKIFGRKKLIFAVTLLVIFAVLILLKLEFGTGRVRQAKLMLNFYVGEKTAFVMVLADCFPLDMPGDVVLCFLSAALAVRLVPAARSILGNIAE